MDDLVKEFLVESYENLERLDRDFVELEKNPSKETLGSIFRAIHTIKGTCGFLGFSKLGSITHVGESLLSLLRDGQLRVNPTITDALLAMVDAIREVLSNIENAGGEGDGEYSSLIELLGVLQKGEIPVNPSRISVQQNHSAPQPEVSAPVEDLEEKFGELAVQEGRVKPEELDQVLARQAKEDPRRNGEITIQQDAVKPAEILETLQTQSETRAAVSESTVRVDVGLLDKLMNLVGELVLSRNQIAQFAANQEGTAFLTTSQHLNLVTSELQEGVMKTRMQPIGNVWNKLPRVVRDLAAACGKQVRVDMEGAETELDRTIIEAIKDPMTHVVRNSIDHGIESPEERVAAGKGAEGRLLLRAFHEGGQVNIEISDDGGGVNPEKVRDKALQRGLISPDQAMRMTERELVDLIFLPGFSTAEKVTNLSGRGVGMDVVKTNIEKICGTVDVKSELGEGTTLKIKIPLTLAIIPALMVTTGGDCYAIPQVSLVEIVHLDGQQAGKAVEMVHEAPVFRLRDNLLPLVYLNKILNISEQRNEKDAPIHIVVLQANGREFGLVVDGIGDSKDIVVKALGNHLKGLFAFSGATILGDGKIALILDIIGISQSAQVITEDRQPSLREAPTSTQQAAGEWQGLLICRYGGEGRAGIPLSVVARLEEFPVSAIEKSQAREVVQYRGEIMPLIRLVRVLDGQEYEDGSKQRIQVVVYRDQGRSVGLVVEQIADIVEEQVNINADDGRGGFAGTAVVQGKVTDILDMRRVIASANLSYIGQSETA